MRDQLNKPSKYGKPIAKRLALKRAGKRELDPEYLDGVVFIDGFMKGIKLNRKEALIYIERWTEMEET